MKVRIPIYKPYLTSLEQEYVLECLSSTWISSKGKFINEFETKFGEYAGAQHAIAVSNGTTALHVALLALGIGKGDEVLVPSLTYIASANAIKYTGAIPVFVDSEPQYWQIDVSDLKKKITRNTKAIMPVHLYGHPCDMQEITAVARENSLSIIEDCAEAIGSKIGSKVVGTFSDVSTFSFFGNKTITTGEGGMVLTDNPIVAERVRKLKGQGLAQGREYWHDEIGYNYRMTNICAAIGCAQLQVIDKVLKIKKEISRLYIERLRDLPLKIQPERPGYTNTYWLVSGLAESREHRDKLRMHLANKGIETRPLFPPVHQMPIYNDGLTVLANASMLADRGLSFPSFPELREEDVDEICFEVRDYYNKAVACRDI